MSIIEEKWELSPARNKHYIDAVKGYDYEATIQKCYYIGVGKSGFVADLVVTESEEGEAIAKLIVAAPETMRQRDMLLDACKQDAELATQAINRTPSGPLRNKLTEINILRLQAIANAKKKD